MWAVSGLCMQGTVSSIGNRSDHKETTGEAVSCNPHHHKDQAQDGKEYSQYPWQTDLLRWVHHLGEGQVWIAGDDKHMSSHDKNSN